MKAFPVPVLHRASRAHRPPAACAAQCSAAGWQSEHSSTFRALRSTSRRKQGPSSVEPLPRDRVQRFASIAPPNLVEPYTPLNEQVRAGEGPGAQSYRMRGSDGAGGACPRAPRTTPTPGHLPTKLQATAMAEEGRTVLTGPHAAAIASDPGSSEDAVRTLLAAAPDATAAASTTVTVHGEGGLTLLHLAAAMGNEAAARLLLEAAPSTASALTADGSTPLLAAAACGHSGIVSLLLAAAPATARAANLHGQLPIHLAVAEGHSESVRMLLAAAPDTALIKLIRSRAAPHCI